MPIYGTCKEVINNEGRKCGAEMINYRCGPCEERRADKMEEERDEALDLLKRIDINMIGGDEAVWLYVTGDDPKPVRGSINLGLVPGPIVRQALKEWRDGRNKVIGD